VVWIRKARCLVPTFGSVPMPYKPCSYLVHLFMYVISKAVNTIVTSKTATTGKNAANETVIGKG
jgi:hypothetical protein